MRGWLAAPRISCYLGRIKGAGAGMNKLIAAVLVFCASSISAHAQAPDFDTEAYCRSTLKSRNVFSQQKMDYCLQTERSARAMLQGDLGKAADADMKRCAHVASTAGKPGQGSYGSLVTCLQGAQAAHQDSKAQP
jgi:hypothetical protein